MLLLFSAEIALIMFVSSSCNTFFFYYIFAISCMSVFSFFIYILHLSYFSFLIFCHQVGMLCTTPTDEHVSVRTSD